MYCIRFCEQVPPLSQSEPPTSCRGRRSSPQRTRHYRAATTGRGHRRQCAAIEFGCRSASSWSGRANARSKCAAAQTPTAAANTARRIAVCSHAAASAAVRRSLNEPSASSCHLHAGLERVRAVNARLLLPKNSYVTCTHVYESSLR